MGYPEAQDPISGKAPKHSEAAKGSGTGISNAEVKPATITVKLKSEDFIRTAFVTPEDYSDFHDTYFILGWKGIQKEIPTLYNVAAWCGFSISHFMFADYEEFLKTRDFLNQTGYEEGEIKIEMTEKFKTVKIKWT